MWYSRYFTPTLMKRITNFVIWGVTTLPLKRNHVPRFTKEGEHKKMMEDAFTVYQEGYRNSCKEENFSIIHATFPSVCGRHSNL
jgi:hypothetical protein